MLLDFVWDRYKNKTITELINILHGEGTPWKYCYRPNENVTIPDEMTKIYYDSIVENAFKVMKFEQLIASYLVPRYFKRKRPQVRCYRGGYSQARIKKIRT